MRELRFGILTLSATGGRGHECWARTNVSLTLQGSQGIKLSSALALRSNQKLQILDAAWSKATVMLPNHSTQSSGPSRASMSMGRRLAMRPVPEDDGDSVCNSLSCGLVPPDPTT